MKKMMVLGVSILTVSLIAGCTKKEAQVSVEEPIVTEETTAIAMANMETASVSTAAAVAVEPSALEAASSAVAQTVAAVIENPTNQQIQEALKSAGYYDGKIDGSIGPKTKRAIETFQKDNGLTADGKVGPKTWNKLGAHLVVGAVDQAVSAPATEPILGTEIALEDQAVSN